MKVISLIRIHLAAKYKCIMMNLPCSPARSIVTFLASSEWPEGSKIKSTARSSPNFPSSLEK